MIKDEYMVDMYQQSGYVKIRSNKTHLSEVVKRKIRRQSKQLARKIGQEKIASRVSADTCTYAK